MSATGAGGWLAEEWAALLAAGIEAVAGERPQVACQALAEELPEIIAQQGPLLWWRQGLPLPGEPALWVGAPQAAWSALGGRILRATGVEDSSEARETYLDILCQTFTDLLSGLSRRWHRELPAPPATEQSAAPSAAEFYSVQAAYPDAPLPPLLVALAGELEIPAPPPEPAPEPAVPRSQTFDLLMDVELPVSVSFGHAEIALKDILKLTTGSILELNRTVEEPVDVIVNNCVVARGEVVVVEGNYGVRIRQIMSRQGRLETVS